MEPSQIEVVRMGGRQDPQVSMLAFIDIESRIPLDHPLRTIEDMADGALAELPQEIGARAHLDRGYCTRNRCTCSIGAAMCAEKNGHLMLFQQIEEFEQVPRLIGMCAQL